MNKPQLNLVDDSDADAHSFSPVIHYLTAAPGDEAAPQTPITVLFHDEHTLESARSLCGKLFKIFGTDSFHTSEWWASTLGIRTFYDMAMTDATRSEIVILALRSTDPLPEAVSRWIQSWTKSRAEHGGALVALFVSHPDDPPHGISADKQLRRMARAAGLDYFAHHPEQTHVQPADPRKQSMVLAQPVATARRNSVISPMAMTHSGWGINE